MLKVGDLGKTTHGLNVLKRVQDRFIDTSIGEGAKETTNAILHWLHELIQYILPYQHVVLFDCKVLEGRLLKTGAPCG